MLRPVVAASDVVLAEQPGDGEACAEEQRHLQEIDPDQPVMAFERDVEPVAQNVLGIAFVDSEPREFRLMDQDPADVAPEEAGQRRVRVRLFVCELMMAAVNGDPARRRFLQAGHRDDDHGVLEPFGTFQAAVGEKSMVAEVDAEQPAQMGADDRHDEAAPGEIAGHEGKHCHDVIGADADDVRPVQLERLHARGQRDPEAVRRRERDVGREYSDSCGRPWSVRHAEIGPFYREFWAGGVSGRFCYTRVGACFAFINPRQFDAAVGQNRLWNQLHNVRDQRLLRHPGSCDGLIDIRARDGIETRLSRAVTAFRD